MEPSLHLTREDELFGDPKRYKRLVGKLNYLTVTHPDTVSVVSQYMSSPIINHWAIIEWILCCLKEARGQDIVYSNHGHNTIEYFMDANMAGSKEDRRFGLLCLH